MTDGIASTGRGDFVARHGLYAPEQRRLAGEIAERIVKDGLDVVRLSFADQHGLLRGKALTADAAISAFASGCSMTTSLLAKDTSHRTVFPIWQSGGGMSLDGMTGAADLLMVPDPSTFRVLPWAGNTGWMLCDIYFPDGTPVPFSTRALMASALAELSGAGYDYLAGLEVEFHLFRMDDPQLRPEQSTQPAAAPAVSLLGHGYQYLNEYRQDLLEPVMELLRRDLVALGLPLRTMEVEFGPSQCEFTFHPGSGLVAADNMMLFRSAVKQICRRNGLHATFMCRPGLANLFSSGWHLHQSLLDPASGGNVFIPETDDALLSPVGRQFVAGLLRHARAGMVFSTPTINGYKRYRPNSLAPDRLLWARDNRGAMLRAVGGAGDPGTRIENRIGEPAANPYLYMASQIWAGLDGLRRAEEPPPPSDTPYDSAAERLPTNLMDAVDALDGDGFFRGAMGDAFVDYLVTIKRAEIARFLDSVTDWEQREYFELY